MLVRYANIIFDLERAAALETVHGYLDDIGIAYCGRYGDWGYLWTDEVIQKRRKRRPEDDRKIQVYSGSREGRSDEGRIVLWWIGNAFEGESGGLPKPMVNIGSRPILWHIMKYYAHYGHKDFILCLGYKADIIKNYFLHYDQYLSSRFQNVEWR